MIKDILIYLGLRKAPTPIRSYAVLASFVGFVPAALYAAWKNREKLIELGHRLDNRVAAR